MRRGREYENNTHKSTSRCLKKLVLIYILYPRKAVYKRSEKYVNIECLLLYDIGCNLYMLIAIDLNPRPVSNEFYALMRTLVLFGSIWTFFKAMIFYNYILKIIEFLTILLLRYKILLSINLLYKDTGKY